MTASGHKFKNEASRRFWEYYTTRIADGTLSREQVRIDFAWRRAYSYSFWKLLEEGTMSVTIDQIEIGAKMHGLDKYYVYNGVTQDHQEPITLNNKIGIEEELVAYGYGEQKSTMPGLVTADQKKVSYGNDLREEFSKEVGQTVNNILNKHRVNRTKYAQERLGITLRSLQRIITGESSAAVEILVKIAEDFAESLDNFRTKPLPAGHMLQLLDEREKRIREQEKVIDALAAAVKADATKASKA